MPTRRIDKIISETGLYSRSDARALVKSGRVTVGANAVVANADGANTVGANTVRSNADVTNIAGTNAGGVNTDVTNIAGTNAVGVFVVKSAAEQFDPESCAVMIDGVRLEYQKFRYIMMNKPEGYVCSTSDRREKTVIDLLGGKYAGIGLFPAGRLDKDATGLLLLTNDGAFAHRITSPANRVGKRYYVQFDGGVSKEDIGAFAGGLTLKDGAKCLPAVLEPTSGGAFVTVYEGKYHQVKRMMAALGKPVKHLKRVSIGGLELDGKLKPGEYREIHDEISQIIIDK